MVRFENGVVFLAIASSALLILSEIFFLAAHHSGPTASAAVVLTVLAMVLWTISLRFWWKGYLRRTPKAFIHMLKIGAH